MDFLRRTAANPVALLAFLLAGGLAGSLVPVIGSYASVLGQIYLAVVSMAALPLVVVAIFFGLRQVLALPHALRRVLMIGGLAVFLVAACAVIGVATGAVLGTGKALSLETRQHLGLLVQTTGGEAANAEIALFNRAAAVPGMAEQRQEFVPSNFFRALVDGNAANIALCSILFGLAFAVISRERSSALASIFEATYRTFETIISNANIFIPILVFGMAAFLVASAGRQTMVAMGSFLVSFTAVSVALAGMAVVIIRKQSGASIPLVLSALKAPALVSLTSSSSTASIPGAIEAMSVKLGFSRGVVELVTPLAAVFARTGAALYFALLAVFVMNLYGREIALGDAVLICSGASLAALASAGNNGLATLGFAGMVLSMLKLPIEAALALFVAIDIVCEGPRNLLTLMFSCVLIALVSSGLPSERLAAKGSGPALGVAPVKVALSPAEVALVVTCITVAGALILGLGIGVGMKEACEPEALSISTGAVSGHGGAP